MESLSDILKHKTNLKAPAYPWQELALRIIKELAVPNFKRSSVFKACKENPTYKIELALNDTKELCHNGSKWQYFFKIVGQEAGKEAEIKIEKKTEEKNV